MNWHPSQPPLSERDVFMSLVLHFDDEAVLAAALARSLAWECAPLQCHHFPDGEVKLTLPGRCPSVWCWCAGCSSPTPSWRRC
jgi:hypothetical protein